MTAYTVFRTADSSDARSGLTLAQAADELLTADGHSYEIRPEADGDGFRLWISDLSRRLVASRFFGLAADLAAAEAEIFGQVVATDDWHGMEAMEDDDFRAMLSEAAEDDAQE